MSYEELLEKYSDLGQEYDELLELIKILKENLGAKQKLCDFYMRENENLKATCELWRDKAMKLERLLNN